MARYIVQWIPDLDTLYVQGSVMESVIVGVSGTLIDNNDVEQNFVQTFVLVPQEGGGFYVHNDVLQSINAAQHLHDTEDTLEIENAANKDRTDKSTSKNMVAESSKGKNIVTVDPKKNSQSSVWKSVEKMQIAEAKQVSYASMLAKDQGSAKPSVFPNSRPLQNIYDGKTVYVKNLPPTMTQESLLEVMKHFGPVKQRNIHIKAYPEDGYCYTFVEFDHPKATSNAVEARFIPFADRFSEIQYKNFPNQARIRHIQTLSSDYLILIINNSISQFHIIKLHEDKITRGGHHMDRENSGMRIFGAVMVKGRGGGSWSHRHNEHENYGQTRDYNYMDDRYFQGYY
ncbi:nuclear transport factor 2-like [Bidens hawaiensis]|uniref:nuclear transport factor 2-like n=1 Tax=Bidens hawaiensis TaxID=980011 RepID=UPI004049B2C7